MRSSSAAGRHARGVRSSLALLIAAGAIACGGEEPPPSELPAPTFENIQALILAPACATSGCHDATTKGGELDLSSAGVSYVEMVRVPATNRVGRANRWVLVEPGSSGKSFLIRKMVSPGPGEGDPMPSTAEQVSPVYLEMIQTWIDGGAAR